MMFNGGIVRLLQPMEIVLMNAEMTINKAYFANGYQLWVEYSHNGKPANYDGGTYATHIEPNPTAADLIDSPAVQYEIAAHVGTSLDVVKDAVDRYLRRKPSLSH